MADPMTEARCYPSTKTAQYSDEGSAIILALIFVFGVSLAMWALVSFTGGALISSGDLRIQRATEYSADSATEMAIQAVRYRPNAYTTSGSCLGPASSTFNGIAMKVVCSGTQNSGFPQSGPGSIAANKLTVTSSILFTSSLPASFFVGWTISDLASQGGDAVIPSGTTVQAENNAANSITLSTAASASESSDTFVLSPPQARIVNFYTCATSVSSCSVTTALVVAEVSFNDYSVGGVYSCNSSSSLTCGSGMTIEQWNVATSNA